MKGNGSLFYNRAAKRIFGYSAVEVIGQPLDILLPNGLIEAHREHIRRFVQAPEAIWPGGETREVLARRKDGSLCPIEVSVARIAVGNQVILCAILRDITERKRVEARDARRFQILTALYASAQRLAESLDLKEVSQEITRVCVELFGVRLAWLGRAEEDGRVEILAQFPVDHPYPRQITVRWDETPLGQGPTGRAIRSGVPQFVADIAEDTHYSIWCEQALSHGFASSAAFPLVSRGHIFGALNLYGDMPRFFNGELKEAFRALANLAAAAVENSRLYDEARRRLREMEIVSAFAIALRSVQTTSEVLSILLREARHIVAADGAEIILLDSTGEKFTVVQADGILSSEVGVTFGHEEGISGEVLRTREPYKTDDYASDPHHLARVSNSIEMGPTVHVPLHTEREPLGVLVVARKRGGDPHPFGWDEVHLLSVMGEIAASTLRRVKLYEDAQRRLRQVQALRSIDMAILASLDLRLTLRALLDEVIRHLEVDAASVLLLNPYTQELEYRAGRGFRTSAIENSRLRLGEGVAGRAAVERRVLTVVNLAWEGNFVRKKLLQEEGFAAYSVAPLISRGQLLGVLEIFRRAPLERDREWIEFLEALASQAAIAVDNARLFNELEQSNIHLRLAYDATIEGWSRAMDLRDKETEGHTQRVTELTVRLARAAGMREEEIVHVRRGALLHDIGKLGVPDRILNKAGELTEEEWAIMRQHPQFAYDMLASIEYLRPALAIPWCHHERWDGSGYPRGLKGKEIPLAARLFAVVDVWDALRSERSYRKAWSKEETLAYIKANSGTHFDPWAVELFLKVIEEIQKGI